MPAKKTTGGINVSDVEETLPKTYFVMRGQIASAFGFSREETATLITQGVFVAKYPFGSKTRARFVRGQVLAVARNWNADR